MTSAIFPTPETARRLEALLWSRLQGRVRTLRVLVRDNGLVLQGCANSWYGKQLAQHELMGLSKLPLLANEIEVNRQGAAEREWEYVG
jgi:hypothetical protein